MDKSAGSKNIADVTITFDGLMLFHFDSGNNRCEVRFRRADAHEMKITVYQEGKKDNDEITETYTHRQLIQFDELRLQIGLDENQGPAVQGDHYDEILRLDGEDFYGGMGTLKMKPGQYHLTLLLCVGEVGTASVTAPCKRVTKTDEEIVSNGLTYSFGHLKYDMPNERWEELAGEFNGLIKTINHLSRWVDATIDLDTGQDLILTGKNQSGVVDTLPLIRNYNEQDKYWIHISHLDLPAPQSLGHCKGMAHLCESFKLNGQPLYGVFAPRPEKKVLVPSRPWRLDILSTEVTCCTSARVEQFQME